MSAENCQLCHRSEETKATGLLLTKSRACAHLQCLLYSSGIWCVNTDLDDLNGFAVDDVMEEIRRGQKLPCHKCKRNGATVGCEIKHCQRSYHYPCALEDGAANVHDEDRDTYAVYCPRHKDHSDNKGSTPVTPVTPAKEQEVKRPGRGNSSEIQVYCMKCEALKGNSALEGSSTAKMLTCSKHTPESDCTDDSEDERAPSEVVNENYKRKLNFSEENDEEMSLKRKRRSINTIDSDSDHTDDLVLRLSSETEGVSRSSSEEKRMCDADSQYEGETIIEPRMKVENLLAPLEFSPPTSPVFFLKQEPLDEEEEMEARNAEKREKAVPAEESRNPRVRFHQQFLDTYRKKDSKGLASGSGQGQGDAEPSPYEAESIIPSDVDSDSLLAPVRIKHDGFQGRSASQVGPSQGADSENGVSSQRSRTQSRLTDPVDMPDYYQYAGTGLFSSPVSPTPFESNGGPKAIMDSATFWKNCNMAGCTEDFFTDLVSEMSRLSHRIQADQASQNDYDVALKLMEAGGRLALLVGNKQKELEERQVELIQAQTAMKTVTAALRR